LAAVDLQNGKSRSKEAGVIFIGLAREVSHWIAVGKGFLKK
jgi:hypothetical protein